MQVVPLEVFAVSAPLLGICFDFAIITMSIVDHDVCVFVIPTGGLIQ